ncbi:MAG: hypothetical protein V1849_03820 [Chloroflexota bacterium]
MAEKEKTAGATYEPGKPDSLELGRWRFKLSSREEKLRYLQAAERYWYGKEAFGSEKRKTPA